MATGEEGDDSEDDNQRYEDRDYFDEKRNAAARGRVDDILVDGAVAESDWFRCFRFVVIHALFEG